MAQGLARVFKYVLLGAIILMSLAAGVAKVMRMPQEVEFFELAGVPLILLIPFGVLQINSAVFAIFPNTRKAGLVFMGVVFLASALMIFKSGDFFFAVTSLIPVAIAATLAFSRWGAEIRPSK